MISGQIGKAFAHVKTSLRDRIPIVETAARRRPVPQVDVAAPERWRPKRPYHRHLVGRIVYRRQAVQHVTELLCLEQLRLALQHIRNAGVLKAAFERRQGRPTRHENAEVAERRWTDRPIRISHRMQACAELSSHQGYRLPLFLPNLID